MQTLARIVFAGVILGAVTRSPAQVVAAAEPQGMMQVTAAANSDTLISPPLARPPVWRGRLATAGSSAVSISPAPGWAPSQWAPANEVYYLRLTSGSLAGHFFTVVLNTPDTLSIDAAGADLGGIEAGTSAELVPYWTLGTFYPASQANVSFVPSASAFVRQTELLFYDPAGTGINRSPSETYYHLNGAWRKVGASAATSFNSKVLLPDTWLIHRNKAVATVVTVSGRVHTGRLCTALEARSGTRQDNYVAVAYPVPISLRRSGLAACGAFSASPSPFSRVDELLVFDLTEVGLNRSPSATYYYYNSGWRKVGAAVSADFSDDAQLPPCRGFILRKAPGSTSSVWVFETQLSP